MELKIDDDIKKEISNVLNDNAGIKFTKDQLNEIIDNFSPTLIGEIIEFGTCDTLTVEHIMNVFADVKIGMKWPLYGNDQEYKDKFNELYAKCISDNNYEYFGSDLC